MTIEDKILKLTKRLYPTGRAFKIPTGSVFEKIHKAINKVEAEAVQGALDILDEILADNDNFTVEDARDWERRLAIQTNESVSLADRKAAIIRKWGAPGNTRTRQHYTYLEGQLQEAGFNLFVHENTNVDTPDVFANEPLTYEEIEHGEIEHGETTHGLGLINAVANYIDTQQDKFFDLAGYETIFFIGAETPGDFADVDADRELELRRLILNLKPAQTVGILLVNYI